MCGKQLCSGLDSFWRGFLSGGGRGGEGARGAFGLVRILGSPFGAICFRPGSSGNCAVSGRFPPCGGREEGRGGGKVHSLAAAVSFVQTKRAFSSAPPLLGLRVLEVSSHHLGILRRAVVWEGGIRSHLKSQPCITAIPASVSLTRQVPQHCPITFLGLFMLAPGFKSPGIALALLWASSCLALPSLCYGLVHAWHCPRSLMG